MNLLPQTLGKHQMLHAKNMRNYKVQKSTLVLSPISTKDEENPNHNLLGFMALLYQVDMRNKQEGTNKEKIEVKK